MSDKNNTTNEKEKQYHHLTKGCVKRNDWNLQIALKNLVIDMKMEKLHIIHLKVKLWTNYMDFIQIVKWMKMILKKYQENILFYYN